MHCFNCSKIVINVKNKKWRQKIINIMVQSGESAIAEGGKTGVLMFALGMYWGGVPGLSEG
jgi:hypothetical protein